MASYSSSARRVVGLAPAAVLLALLISASVPAATSQQAPVDLQGIMAAMPPESILCLTSLAGALTGDCGLTALQLGMLTAGRQINDATAALCSQQCTNAIQAGISGPGCSSVVKAYPALEGVTASQLLSLQQGACSQIASGLPPVPGAVLSAADLLQQAIQELGVEAALGCAMTLVNPLSQICNVEAQQILAASTEGAIPMDVCRPTCLKGLVDTLSTSTECEPVRAMLQRYNVSAGDVTADEVLGQAAGFCQSQLGAMEVNGVRTVMNFTIEQLPSNVNVTKAVDGVIDMVKEKMAGAGVPPELLSLTDVSVLISQASDHMQMSVSSIAMFFSKEDAQMKDFMASLPAQGLTLFDKTTTTVDDSGSQAALILKDVSVMGDALPAGIQLLSASEMLPVEPKIEVGTESTSPPPTSGSPTEVFQSTSDSISVYVSASVITLAAFISIIVA